MVSYVCSFMDKVYYKPDCLGMPSVRSALGDPAVAKPLCICYQLTIAAGFINFCLISRAEDSALWTICFQRVPLWASVWDST